MTIKSPEILRIFLLRHAHAGWPSPGMRDFDRALDEKGLAEARQVAVAAYASGLAPDLVVCSTARRCRQTIDAFLDVFGNLQATYDERLYSDGTDAYLAHIKSSAGRRDCSNIMLVGHNPMIEALAMSLTRPEARPAALAVGYPTAGLLAIDLTVPSNGDPVPGGEIASFLAPL